jgi:hypothetical protein
LTTIKLNKPAPEALQNKASKAPVRRADQNKRDRTVAPPKPVARVDDVQSASKDKMDSRFRENDERGAARVTYFATFHQSVEFKSKL